MKANFSLIQDSKNSIGSNKSNIYLLETAILTISIYEYPEYHERHKYDEFHVNGNGGKYKISCTGSKSFYSKKTTLEEVKEEAIALAVKLTKETLEQLQ